MVKLVDTLVSGTSGFTAVQVRVLFRALEKESFISFPFFLPGMISFKRSELIVFQSCI